VFFAKQLAYFNHTLAGIGHYPTPAGITPTATRHLLNEGIGGFVIENRTQ
jgi:hypothetical protein